MSTELDDRLAALAAAWETAALPVAMAEIRGRTAGPALDVDGLSTALTLAPVRPRRRTWPLVAAAVAVAAGLVVMVAVVVRDSGHHTLTPAATAPETALPTSVVTTAPPPTSEPPPALTIPIESQIAQVTREVNERLSQLHSFRATATVHAVQQEVSPIPSVTTPVIDQTMVNTITLMADGSIWSEGDSFHWTSYDAATGVSRGEFGGADGGTQYQEIVGWPDNSTPLLILFGYDPVMRFDAMQQPTLTEVTSHLGRPAWQITSTFEGGYTETTPVTQTETYTIDQQTGLVVAYDQRQTQNGVETNVREARIDDLEVGATLPAAFPGAFPEGAVVDRSGDPNGFVPLSVADAGAMFGSGFVVPAGDGAPVPRTTVNMFDMPATDSSPGGVMYQASIESRTGFVRSTVSISKSTITSGSPLQGWIVIDGLLCASPDGVHCVGFDGPSMITAGALAGVPSRFDGRVLIIDNGPVQIVVDAATPEAALVIANSLTTVES